MFAPLLLLLAARTATAARPPKKFEAAQEVRLDGSTIKAMGDQLFCVAPPEKPAVTLLFSSVTWDITFDPEARRSRARAASDDDFHEAGASLVAKLVGADRGSLSKELDEKLARRPLFPMPWDSCPNPFSDCVLDLSPFGNSCARVSSSQPYEVRAVLDRGMPVRPLMVLAGAALLGAAHALSASTVFQYAAAVTGFEVAAACLIVVFLVKRAGGGMRSTAAAVSLYSLLVLRKGGTLLKTMLVHHWELCLVYFVFVAVVACWATSTFRKVDATKDTVRVASKWTLRLVAVALLHNAFKAPAAQFAVYGILFVAYLRTRVLKLARKKQYYREDKTK